MAKHSHPLFSSIACSPVTAINTSEILMQKEMRAWLCADWWPNTSLNQGSLLPQILRHRQTHRMGQRDKEEGFRFLLTCKWKGQTNPYGNSGLLPCLSYMRENSFFLCALIEINWKIWGWPAPREVSQRLSLGCEVWLWMWGRAYIFLWRRAFDKKPGNFHILLAKVDGRVSPSPFPGSCMDLCSNMLSTSSQIWGSCF